MLVVKMLNIKLNWYLRDFIIQQLVHLLLKRYYNIPMLFPNGEFLYGDLIDSTKSINQKTFE